MRTNIGKALQRRSEAIRRALERYNTQAAQLNPPRPQLGWKQIVEYAFLAEFDLLRYSRSDVRLSVWTEPARREATIKYLQLQRAQEEIVRLNIEIRRLRTVIHDEGLQIQEVIDELRESTPSLAEELSRRHQLRCMVNAIHIGRLDRIESLPGFSGQRGVGVAQNHGLKPTRLVNDILARELHDMSVQDEEDEEVTMQVEGVADYIAGISD